MEFLKVSREIGGRASRDDVSSLKESLKGKIDGLLGDATELVREKVADVQAGLLKDLDTSVGSLTTINEKTMEAMAALEARCVAQEQRLNEIGTTQDDQASATTQVKLAQEESAKKYGEFQEDLVRVRGGAA